MSSLQTWLTLEGDSQPTFKFFYPNWERIAEKFPRLWTLTPKVSHEWLTRRCTNYSDWSAGEITSFITDLVFGDTTIKELVRMIERQAVHTTDHDLEEVVIVIVADIAVLSSPHSDDVHQQNKLRLIRQIANSPYRGLYLTINQVLTAA